MGREFVNYRKTTMKETRLRFSNRVRESGLGNVPVVIDSVDSELSDILREVHSRTSDKYMTYGREMVFHMDSTLNDVLREVKIIMLQKNKEAIMLTQRLTLGLENGTIPKMDSELGNLYKLYRNKDDKILYLMLSRETTAYGYIISILSFLREGFNKLIYTGNTKN